MSRNAPAGSGAERFGTGTTRSGSRGTRGSFRARGPDAFARGQGTRRGGNVQNQGLFADASGSAHDAPFRGDRGGRGRGRGVGRGRIPPPRPTHFLAIPLGTHSILRKRISDFTDALLNNSPPIGGLESSIVVDPRRMHFTLGVMALRGDEEIHRTIQETGDETRSVEDALELLKSLKPQILNILNPTLALQELGRAPTHTEVKLQPIRIALNTMDVLKPDSNGGANVLWIGPDVKALSERKTVGAEGTRVTPEDDDDMRKLVEISQLVHQAFKRSGFIVETRPLKLHCTLVNTSYRRVRGRPFAYDAILASDALENIQKPMNHSSNVAPTCTSEPLPDAHNTTTSASPNQDPRLRQITPVSIDLGTWTAKEIQLCRMGSYGPENEYVSVGRARLDTLDQ